MSRRLLPTVALAFALLGACGEDGDDVAPVEQRGAGLGGREAAAPSPSGANDDPMRAPGPESRPRLADYDVGEAPAGDPFEEQPAEAREAQPIRDLSAELRSVIGDPSSCLRGLDLPDEVTIEVHATVVATGIITRSEARGAGVPERGLDCVRDRLSTARLRAPVEAAPRAVRASLELRRSAEP